MDKKFKDKKVLVFGLGLNQGGVGSAQFFSKQGSIVKVTDLKSKEILKPSIKQLKEFKNISYTVGEHKYEDVTWADLIIKNPAVKPENPFIKYAEKHNKQIETDMGIFLQNIRPDQIIGITGTKGKSTTASLIYEVIKKAKKDVVLAGNIGVSVLDTIPCVKPRTLVVLEISSFQLEAFDTHKVSPKWAVITNIYPDHLNYYNSMDEYITAKKIVGLYQTPADFLFINKDDPVSNDPKFLKGLKGQIVFFSSSDLPKDFQPFLIGEHNKSNIAAAFAVSKTLGLALQALQGRTLQALEDFSGIEFRLQLIYNKGGVKIYNDTAATSPEAGIQAIKSLSANLIHLFESEPSRLIPQSRRPPGGLILICGGMNKKMDYTEYAMVVGKFVKKVFFLEGDSTDSILSSLRSASRRRSNLPIHGPYNNIEKLLTDVKATAKPGDIILFSPAATSFNLFQNEFDRGRKFNKAVWKIFKDA